MLLSIVNGKSVLPSKSVLSSRLDEFCIRLCIPSTVQCASGSGSPLPKTGIFHSPLKTPHPRCWKFGFPPHRFFPLTAEIFSERAFCLIRELYWLEKTDWRTLFAWQNKVLKWERGQMIWDLVGTPPGWTSEISEIWVPPWSIPPPAFKKCNSPSAKFFPHPELRGEHTKYHKVSINYFLQE